MWLLGCVLLAAGAFGLVTVALRRRAMGPRASTVGGALLALAFCSLFVGVLADAAGWLPYVAWAVAGAGAALVRHASGWAHAPGAPVRRDG